MRFAQAIRQVLLDMSCSGNSADLLDLKKIHIAHWTIKFSMFLWMSRKATTRRRRRRRGEEEGGRKRWGEEEEEEK